MLTSLGRTGFPESLLLYDLVRVDHRESPGGGLEGRVMGLCFVVHVRCCPSADSPPCCEAVPGPVTPLPFASSVSASSWTRCVWSSAI